MHQRRRIVLLFGLGIVLPSLLLGYLAFRGIQNDRALVEKERMEGMSRAAGQVVRAVESGIASVETAFSKVAANRSEEATREQEADLEKLAAERPLVEEVFCLRDRDGIHFPAAKILYVLDGRREAGLSPVAEPSQSAEFRAAERMEFREKNYKGALAAYRQALGRVSDPRLAGQMLNAVARAQKKSGLLKEAIKTYESMARDHGDVIIAGGMPLGPSASLEVCAITRELGDVEKSLRTSVELYRSLLRRDWDLEKAEFEFFAGRAKSEIGASFSDPPPDLDVSAFQAELEALRKEEEDSRERTERAIVFQEGAGPALKAKIATAGARGAPHSPFVRLALDVGNISYLVSIESPSARAGVLPETAWGFIIDAVRLREDILRPALRDYSPSGETSWTVKGRDGTVVLSSENLAGGPAAFRANFDMNFPDWTLEFHQPPPRLIKTFLLSRRGFYFFVFLLIAGILVFGLILTIRSVSHELELARMKSDFVSTVSHEFKSPLTSIRQLAEMLQSGRVPSEERRQKYYDVLLEQSERLALLTDNILGLARIEEGREEFRFEKTNISALLAEVVGSIQERVRHEGFDIGLEVKGPLPLLSVDRTALSQALTNLLDNAIKYSGDSREISVTVSLEEETVAIAVRDQGVGIKKEDVPRLFERFYRGGDELTRAVKGSGLGLTLVQKIAAAHRGSVHVESEPGKGSMFTLRLPLPCQKGG